MPTSQSCINANVSAPPGNETLEWTLTSLASSVTKSVVNESSLFPELIKPKTPPERPSERTSMGQQAVGSRSEAHINRLKQMHTIAKYPVLPAHMLPPPSEEKATTSKQPGVIMQTEWGACQLVKPWSTLHLFSPFLVKLLWLSWPRFYRSGGWLVKFPGFAEPAYLASHELSNATITTSVNSSDSDCWSLATSEVPRVVSVPCSFSSLLITPSAPYPASVSLAPFTVIPTPFGSAVLLSRFSDGWNARFANDREDQKRSVPVKKVEGSRSKKAKTQEFVSECSTGDVIVFLSHDDVNSFIQLLEKKRREAAAVIS